MAALAEFPALTVELVARQSRTDDGSASVSDQLAAMQAEAERLGWTVGGIHEETDVSGQRPLARRRGLSAAIDAIEGGRAQAVMVAYFDRLCRNLRTQLEVVERVEAAGGRVQIAGGQTLSHATPTDRLTGSLLGAVAEYVALTAGERTAVTKQRNIDAGIPPFPRITPAYRRRADGTLEQDPTNGPLIREACLMRARGASYGQIQDYLRSEGLELTWTGLRTTLASPLLVGEIRFGSFRPNLHAIDDPIIDHATRRAMFRARATRGRQSKSERLLARLGILHCGTCGARMSVNTATGAGGKRYPYYSCGDRNRSCGAPAMIGAELAEDAIRDKAIELGEEVRGRASLDLPLEEARLARERAESALATAIRSLARLGGEAATQEVLDLLQAERDAAVDAHERLLALTAPTRTVTLEQWDSGELTLDDKRAAIRAVIVRATVAPGRGPGRITIEGRELLGEDAPSGAV